MLGIIPAFALAAQSVGVVLSGGGAKGLAHIGVLRALEENNIPIDYITGTSIGAMVGGLYAAGFSPDEIEAMFKSDDFERWSEGIIESKYYYFYKKSRPNAELVSLKVHADSVNTKAYLPNKIVAPHQMDFAFMQVYAQAAAACKYDFDSLYVPFRCVASDIYKKEAVIFSEGNLPSAVRASMTFPFYFQPIKIDNRILFDGGIYDNFPKKTMIEDFNPDVIIGVKVAGNFERPAQDDIVSQLENMIADYTDYSIPEEKGLLISPDISDIGLWDFELADKIVFRGYDAAMYRMNDIKKFVERRIDSTQRAEKRNAFREKYPPLVFKNIYVQGLNKFQEKYAAKSILHKHEIIGIDKLRDAYFKLVADEHIEQIYPVAKYNPKESAFDLHMKAKLPKKIRAGIGGHFSVNALNQAYLGAKYKHLGARAYRISGNIYFGNVYNSGMITGRIDVPGRVPFYLSGEANFNRWNYIVGAPQSFFDDKQPPYIIENESFLRFNAGTAAGANGKFLAGFSLVNNFADYYQIKNFNSFDTPDNSQFAYTDLHGGFEYYTLDSPFFPTSGTHLRLSLRYIYGIEVHESGSTSVAVDNNSLNYYYPQAKFDFQTWLKTGKRFTLGLRSVLFFSDGQIMNNYTSTLINAEVFKPIPYSKFLFNEKYRAHNFFAGGPAAVFHFTDAVHFRLEAYGFQAYRRILPKYYNNGRIRAEYSGILPPLHYSGTAALVWHTIAGTLSLSYNYLQNSGHNHYVMASFGKLIFNRRAKE